MQPGALNLDIHQDEDWSLTITVVDQTSAPIDLSARSYAASIRRYADSADSTPISIDASSAGVGVLVLSLARSVTAALAGGVWELEETVSGKRAAILAGRAVVSPFGAPGASGGNTALVQIAAASVTVVSTAAVGPQGPSGSGGGSAFIFQQATPALSWTINHNLGRRPSTTVVDTSGNELLADVQYLSDNTVQAYFTAATAGAAYLN